MSKKPDMLNLIDTPESPVAMFLRDSVKWDEVENQALKSLIDLGFTNVDMEDKAGIPPLIHIARQSKKLPGITNAIGILVNAGVNINRTSIHNGTTALIVGIMSGSNQFVSEMIRNGADVNLVTHEFYGAMDFAVIRATKTQDHTVINYLLDAGIIIDPSNKYNGLLEDVKMWINALDSFIDRLEQSQVQITPDLILQRFKEYFVELEGKRGLKTILNSIKKSGKVIEYLGLNKDLPLADQLISVVENFKSDSKSDSKDKQKEAKTLTSVDSKSADSKNSSPKLDNIPQLNYSNEDVDDFLLLALNKLKLADTTYVVSTDYSANLREHLENFQSVSKNCGLFPIHYGPAIAGHFIGARVTKPENPQDNWLVEYIDPRGSNPEFNKYFDHEKYEEITKTLHDFTGGKLQINCLRTAVQRFDDVTPSHDCGPFLVHLFCGLTQNKLAIDSYGQLWQVNSGTKLEFTMEESQNSGQDIRKWHSKTLSKQQEISDEKKSSPLGQESSAAGKNYNFAGVNSLFTDPINDPDSESETAIYLESKLQKEKKKDDERLKTAVLESIQENEDEELDDDPELQAALELSKRSPSPEPKPEQLKTLADKDEQHQQT